MDGVAVTDTSGNVQAMSKYTIGTTGTITYAEFLVFQTWATNQITADGVTDTDGRAAALLVCHYISQKCGESGKVSESIGKYSYTRKISSATPWLDAYNELVGGGVGDLDTDGIIRDDATMTGLSLDQSTPYDLADEGRDE